MSWNNQCCLSRDHVISNIGDVDVEDLIHTLTLLIHQEIKGCERIDVITFYTSYHQDQSRSSSDEERSRRIEVGDQRRFSNITMKLDSLGQSEVTTDSTGSPRDERGRG